MSWFDIGNALLNQGQAPSAGGAAAASPGVSGSDYLRTLLMSAMGRAPSGLTSLSPGAGAPPEMNGGDGSDGAGGNTSGITGLDPSLVGMGIQGSGLGMALGGFPSLAMSLLSMGLGTNAARGFFGSNLSNENGPVAFTGPSQGLTGNLLSSLASMFGFGSDNPSFVGQANVAPGVNANLGTEFEGLAPTSMPVGISPSSPNVGPYSGMGAVPSTFSGIATGAGTGNASPGSTNFGATPDAPSPTIEVDDGPGTGPTGNGNNSDSGIGPGTGTSPTGDEGDSGDGGGGGGGGGGSSVICSELRRQGLMDDLIWAADERFGHAQTRAVRDGYRCWAQYIARGMKRSPWLTRIVSRLAIPWAYEMAYLMGARSRGSLLGRALMFAGLPFCAFLGKLRSTWRTA